MLNVILDFFFPKNCVSCKMPGVYFCTNCIKDIKQADLVCPRCEKLSLGGMVHPVCKRKFGLDGLWSLGSYQNPLRLAIQKLKYNWIDELAQELVNAVIWYWAKYQPFFLDQIKKDRGKNWVIVPVPLHWTRKNERGFNQSELIAKKLSQKLGLKYENALKRVRATKSQVKLDSYSRRQNVKNAFSLANRNMLNANILLIDDVWTTGSTLKECSFVLKKAGAKKIWAVTLAK